MRDLIGLFDELSRLGDEMSIQRDHLKSEIEITDSASIANTTERKRDTTADAAATSLFGYEQAFGAILPETVDPTDLIDISVDTDHKDVGTFERAETISLKVAALVTQVLPSGNMVIQGRQEVRINFEVRELLVHGVVRPEDIASDNTVSYERIAEARIAYGGRSQLTDVQQPRYGTQVLDAIYPF
jgi:flagellar L-ring protein precursor FlgH